MIEKNRKRITEILLNNLNKRTFSGCALGFSCLADNGLERVHLYEGKSGREDHFKKVDKYSFFDVASLTKPLVTLLSILSLLKEKKIDIEENLTSLLPLSVPEDKKKIRLKHLLSHTSGLPAHKEYFKKIIDSSSEGNPDILIPLILREKLHAKPGQIYVYSDLDFILLGKIIEIKSGQPFYRYWQEKIINPLGLTEKFFIYGDKRKKGKSTFVETGVCSWSGKILRGVVHDDNCRSTGRIQGHAGLFSTLEGIMDLSEHLLLSVHSLVEHPFYNRNDLLYFTSAKYREKWPYGFDIPTGHAPSCGKGFSAKTIGHLGYTGTSFWIDMQKRRVVVLLTNRVIYGADKSNIQEMRPLLHDAVTEELDILQGNIIELERNNDKK